MNSVSSKKDFFKNGTFIAIFVISIIVIGVSVSYAFYTANMTGSAKVPSSSAAILDITSSITGAEPINAAKLSIIDAADYLTKAEKVSFTVTNGSTSNVKGKYTIKLVGMSLSKNLASKYFKWALKVNAGTANEKSFTGSFADASLASEGSTDPTVVTGLSKTLINDAEALTLDINTTDTIDFYIWLENDAGIDQIYLTNGNFAGKLSMDAVPTK